MEKTEEVLRLKVRHSIDRIVAKVKRDAAREIRDEMLEDLVRVKYKTPPELQPQPKETEAQAKARRKKLEEWNGYIYGAEFSYDFDHPLVSDIVGMINEEINNYVYYPKKWAEWKKANSLETFQISKQKC